MNKVFEKIIEKLEERTSFLSDCTKYGNKDAEQQNKSYSTMMMYEVADLVDDLIEIVKQEAEKFGTDTNVGSNGWIPCSERLPEDDSICIVTVEYPNNKTMVDYGWFDRKNVCWFVGTQEFRTSNILAWQPLPEPYQPKGE